MRKSKKPSYEALRRRCQRLAKAAKDAKLEASMARKSMKVHEIWVNPKVLDQAAKDAVPTTDGAGNILACKGGPKLGTAEYEASRGTCGFSGGEEKLLREMFTKPNIASPVSTEDLEMLQTRLLGEIREEFNKVQGQPDPCGLGWMWQIGLERAVGEAIAARARNGK